MKGYKLVWFNTCYNWIMTGIIGPNAKWFFGYSVNNNSGSLKEDIQKSSIKIFKETSEDWYPSYKLPNGIELVRVSFHYPLATNYSYMVSVWGNDDCGMEKQFVNKQEAMDCFMSIISLKDVTITQLKKLGLHSA